MADLIWKDLYVSSRLLLFVIAFGVLQLAVTASVGPVFLPAALLFSGFLGFGSIFVENAQRTETLLNSLPVSRGKIVTARYMSVLLGIMVGLGISWAVGQVVTRAIPGNAGDPAPFASLLALCFLFVPLALIAAGFLPFYFRWGLGRGLVLSMVTVAVLILLSPVLVKLVLPLTGYSSPLLDSATWIEVGSRLASWLIPRWGFVLGVMLSFAALTMTASCFVSWRLYRTRDV